MKFYICRSCGNIVEKVEDSGQPLVCCGQKMDELVANSTDAANEKHVPVIEENGNEVVVTVGSVEHPMLEEHHISWIYLVTDRGIQRKYLEVDKAPKATVALEDGEKVKAAYEYCNLHGLWIKEV